MNRTRGSALLALVFMLVPGFAVPALAADPPKAGTGQPAAGGQDEMAAMMAAAAPGPEHKLLASTVGDWNATVKMWMAPGTEPMVSKAVSHREAILGGRFVTEAVEGTFMNMPFSGRGVSGYDNLKKEYWGTWIDNMGTGIMMSSGSTPDNGKTFNYTSSMTGPDGKPANVREVIKNVSDKQQVFSMFAFMPDGKEFLTMEITYDKK